MKKNKDYIALVRKVDFIDLYKYGKLHINRDMISEFDCSIEELNGRRDIFDKVFKVANPFDYTFAYLLIHYIKPKSGKFSDVQIEEIQHVYPLDKDAFKELFISFDKQINISEPIWAEYVLNFQQSNLFKACKQGVKNLWEILKLKKMDKKYSSIISDNELKEVIRELFYDERPVGDLSIWIYLLRYERHSFYSEGVKGYFMDAVHVLSNYLSKREIDSIESTDIYHFIEDSRDETYEKLVLAIKKSEICRNFIIHSERASKEIDFLKVAPLFLMMRTMFKKEINVSTIRNEVAPLLKNGESFFYATYLVGIILGQEKTYQALYERWALPILQNAENNNDKSLFDN